MTFIVVVIIIIFLFKHMIITYKFNTVFSIFQGFIIRLGGEIELFIINLVVIIIIFIFRVFFLYVEGEHIVILLIILGRVITLARVRVLE